MHFIWTEAVAVLVEHLFFWDKDFVVQKAEYRQRYFTFSPPGEQRKKKKKKDGDSF